MRARRQNKFLRRLSRKPCRELGPIRVQPDKKATSISFPYLSALARKSMPTLIGNDRRFRIELVDEGYDFLSNNGNDVFLLLTS